MLIISDKIRNRQKAYDPNSDIEILKLFPPLKGGEILDTSPFLQWGGSFRMQIDFL